MGALTLPLDKMCGERVSSLGYLLLYFYALRVRFLLCTLYTQRKELGDRRYLCHVCFYYLMEHKMHFARPLVLLFAFLPPLPTLILRLLGRAVSSCAPSGDGPGKPS